MLLAHDVVFRGDGGGKVPAAIRAIHGRAKVARVLIAGMRVLARFGLSTRREDVNGQPGALYFDRDGKLVSSIYMVPMKDLEAKKAFDDLGVAKEKVDHVDLYYNAGHPGVAEPHYHVVVWYVSAEKAASLK